MSEPGAIKRMPRPGTIVPFGGDSVPDGWLLCNGAAVSRTDYARLYSVIGTAWGAGDGSTTFNVPDGRGRVLQGADSTNSLGVSVGAGLPEIYGRISMRRLLSEDGEDLDAVTGTDGGFTNSPKEGSPSSMSQLAGSAMERDYIHFSASTYNTIYSTSDSVQPPAIISLYMIRY